MSNTSQEQSLSITITSKELPDYNHFIEFLDSELINHLDVCLNRFSTITDCSIDVIHTAQAQLIRITYSILKFLTDLPIQKIPQSLLIIPLQLINRVEFTSFMLNEILDIKEDFNLPSVVVQKQKTLEVCVAYRDIVVMYFMLTAKNLASLHAQFRSASVPSLRVDENKLGNEREINEITFGIDESSTEESVEESIKRIDIFISQSPSPSLSPSPSPRAKRNVNQTKKHRRLSSKETLAGLYSVFKRKKEPKVIELHKLQAFGKFGTTIMVISLLRNYELRDKILEAICKVNDIEFIEEQKDNDLIKNYPLIFGWDDFIDVLDLHQKYNYHQLLDVSNDWEMAFRHFTRFFKEFLSNYIHTLSDIVSNHTVDWNKFPGFKIITNAYFLTFSEDYIYLRETFFDQTEVQLLTASHPYILNHFMTISASKTNIYDIEEVIELMKFYEKMFMYLKSNGCLIDNGFNLKKTQSNRMISQMLCFLYEVIDIFCGETRKNLFDVITKKWFFALSLYWEDRVRGLFLQLIVNKSCLVKKSHIKNLTLDDQAIYQQHYTYGKLDPIAIDERILHKIEKKFAQMKSSVKKESKHIPSHLQIYSKHTVSMLIYFQQQYNDWENSNSVTPLSLVIVEMQQEKDEIDVLFNN
ncbi:Uncharacterized protein QTN25_007303 [Entamoeba marina]